MLWLYTLNSISRWLIALILASQSSFPKKTNKRKKKSNEISAVKNGFDGINTVFIDESIEASAAKATIEPEDDWITGGCCFGEDKVIKQFLPMSFIYSHIPIKIEHQLKNK